MLSTSAYARDVGWVNAYHKSGYPYKTKKGIRARSPLYIISLNVCNTIICI